MTEREMTRRLAVVLFGGLLLYVLLRLTVGFWPGIAVMLAATITGNVMFWHWYRQEKQHRGTP